MTNTTQYYLSVAPQAKDLVEWMDKSIQTAIQDALMTKKIGLIALIQLSFFGFQYQQASTDMSPMMMYGCKPRMPFQLMNMNEVPIEAIQAVVVIYENIHGKTAHNIKRAQVNKPTHLTGNTKQCHWVRQ